MYVSKGRFLEGRLLFDKLKKIAIFIEFVFDRENQLIPTSFSPEWVQKKQEVEFRITKQFWVKQHDDVSRYAKRCEGTEKGGASSGLFR